MNKSNETLAIFDTFIEEIPNDEMNHYKPLKSRKFNQNEKNSDSLIRLFKKIYLYCSLEMHTENKLRYFYFINDKNILFEDSTTNFIYNLDSEIDDDYTIRKMLNDKFSHLLIHPLLYKQVSNSSQSIKYCPRNIKYVAWSLGVIILLHIFEVDKELLHSLYFRSLNNNFSSRILVEQFFEISVKKKNKVILVEKLLNCSGREDKNDLMDFFNKNF